MGHLKRCKSVNPPLIWIHFYRLNDTVVTFRFGVSRVHLCFTLAEDLQKTFPTRLVSLIKGRISKFAVYLVPMSNVQVYDKNVLIISSIGTCVTGGVRPRFHQTHGLVSTAEVLYFTSLPSLTLSMSTL